jgi:hypothetical protein
LRCTQIGHFWAVEAAVSGVDRRAARRYHLAAIGTHLLA